MTKNKKKENASKLSTYSSSKHIPRICRICQAFNMCEFYKHYSLVRCSHARWIIKYERNYEVFGI